MTPKVMVHDSGCKPNQSSQPDMWGVRSSVLKVGDNGNMLETEDLARNRFEGPEGILHNNKDWLGWGSKERHDRSR